MDTTPPRTGHECQDIFLGRQSILDRGRNLKAFELLFRSGRQNSATFGNAVAATSTVINYALNELGLEAVLGSYRGFINLDEEMLLSETIELLPKEKVVLEVLETVRPMPVIVERCRRLRHLGYTLAMDDFVHFDEALLPLLEQAHIVKVDLQPLDSDALAQTVHRLRPFKTLLLAEKVDNPAQFQYCLDLGFDLFQGYFFAKPEIISGKRLSSSELVIMRVLGMLMSDADTLDIEKVFKQDPGLSVNMLRLVNSVGAGTNGNVNSIGSALMVLGRRQLQRWLQLLMFAQLSPCKEFPSPLLQLAAARGKFMELMVAGDKLAEDHAFMAGIMSLMDALLGVPLPEILSGLPVANDVREALLKREGRLGGLLVLVEALERDDAKAIGTALNAAPESNIAQINQAQMQALNWANSIAQPG